MAGMKDTYFGDRPYPSTPGFKIGGTSKEAASKTAGRTEMLRARVVATLTDTIDGLTADEVAFRLKETVLSIRPRLAELRAMGSIEPTGERRTNVSGMSAAVWRVKHGPR